MAVPDDGFYLWEWFFEISNARPDHEKPLQFLEIDAWSRLTRNEPTPKEVEIFFAMDRAYVAAFRGELATNRARMEAENTNRRR